MAYSMKREQEKACTECGHVKPMDAFYKNAGWASQAYRDAWCKECVKKNCKDKVTMKEYFFKNNRLWKDEFWEKAEKQAVYKVATNPEYTRTESVAKKQRILNEVAVSNVFRMMSLATIYSYCENIKDDGNGITYDFDPNSLAGTSAASGKGLDEGTKIKSEKWHGTFTEQQIKYLDEYYEKLEREFSLDNENLRDYARNICKSSLDTSMNFEKYQRGLIDIDAYQKSLKMFDTLSKSASFAQCAKKNSISTGMGSLGEIILKLEMTGKLATRQVTFPPDDIDKINADFAHVLVSVGALDKKTEDIGDGE